MLTDAQIIGISIFGAMAWVIIGFITSAVVASTTRTAYHDSQSVPSGYFAVVAGILWPATLVVAFCYFVGRFIYWLGCILKPGRLWTRLVQRLNPGVKIHW